MKFTVPVAAAAIMALSVPAVAQMQGPAPATLPGTTTRDKGAPTDAGTPAGRAMSSKSPSQNGTSAHDNTTGNNSTSAADGLSGTPATKSSMSPASGREPADAGR